ncbi:hypothetical protein ACYF6T_06530 [Streptomyces sp. 7R007]
MRRRAPAAGLLAAAVLLTGCTQSVDPIERLGRKAAQRVLRHVRHGDARGAVHGAGPTRPSALALRLTEC